MYLFSSMETRSMVRFLEFVLILFKLTIVDFNYI